MSCSTSMLEESCTGDSDTFIVHVASYLYLKIQHASAKLGIYGIYMHTCQCICGSVKDSKGETNLERPSTLVVPFRIHSL